MKKRSLLIVGLLAASFVLGCSGDDDPEVVCIDGELSCNAAGNASLCNDNVLVELDVCIPGLQVCSKGVCVKEAVCEQNSPAVCDGDRVQYCNVAGQYSYTDCASVNRTCELVDGVAVCVDKPSVVCEDGATLCPIASPTQIKVCENNAWVLNDCSEGLVCKAGACILPPVCKEKATRCTVDGIHQVCSSGAWVDLPCGDGLVCEDGACIKPLPCDEGSLRCMGNYAQVCTDNLWTTQEVCEGETPMCHLGVCVAGPQYLPGDDCSATPDLDLCEFNRSTYCLDGVVEIVDCGEYDMTCIPLSTGGTDCGFTGVDDVCKEDGDVFHFGPESICEYNTAENPLVLFGLCHWYEGVFYGVETVNEIGLCLPLQGDKEGVISCDGKEIVITACDVACAFVDEAPMCVECKEGSVSCDGSKVVECHNGHWQEAETCGDDELCSAGACVNKGELVGTDCNTSFVQYCHENQRYSCVKSKVVASDCGDETCVILADKKAYCGEADAPCTKAGDRYLRYDAEDNELTCAIIIDYVHYGNCVDVDGTLYGFTALSKGICIDNDRIGCDGNVKVVETCETACKESGGNASCIE